MVMNIRVIVLGSGLSGLSAAYFLSRSGLHALVLDTLILEEVGDKGWRAPYEWLSGILTKRVPVVKDTRILHVSALPEMHRAHVEIQRPGKKKETLTAHRVVFALPSTEIEAVLQTASAINDLKSLQSGIFTFCSDCFSGRRLDKAVFTGINAAKRVMQSVNL
jgi:predicted NAD/FAD-dependent oxidoreductase